ncbi:MAG: CRISPR-associated endonuclease Cas2 [Meiothermus sp.]|uniref:CRISPR-associated endonuclease Cas2 n=1 Tax=Meiothermus sp. TaxID=1955249 RepID=UPI0025E44D8F|nr:CRISPR-associated endonuclease Cas2 [Meiothermus sp.]MCS7069805.1 CRISPR-associated endonuclease Cas2 [Meiothermus sp.]
MLIQDPRKPGKPVLVLYDIGEDRIRTRVSDACKDYGLNRIQFSAYSGRLTKAAREELELRLGKILGDHSGAITVIQLEQAQFEGAWSKVNP